jgi:hypothetical protein
LPLPRADAMRDTNKLPNGTTTATPHTRKAIV